MLMGDILELNVIKEPERLALVTEAGEFTFVEHIVVIGGPASTGDGNVGYDELLAAADPLPELRDRFAGA